ncbi:helix-turn-helix domain-containing protein [Paenibacillus eucommiae]|uniref:AraC-like DNA-binding protein/mannose-6-phosphate isomerase-like protein (Cupin superfamily) n=1 Tax=Paenibacillus eucommiae TaxID=1355755 RepID=A0ABS4J138_9BACL|nr:AraC family transcriptional regulator [Paenibacillus eucommiae]MBP1993531.1 AraC-like DNA-binding protein/mannose-6-phosphate isomerase-like protein (cupin superfamily) [Paenibacillus eucommiae]
MEIYKEPIYYQNPTLCIKACQFRDEANAPSPPSLENRKWHYHKEIEFILVEQGIHEIQTPNNVYTLTKGDIVLIGSSQLHRGRKLSTEDLIFIVLHVDLQPYFDPAMMMYYRHFSEVHQPLEALNYIFHENEQVKAEVAGIISRIHAEMMHKASGYEIAASMHIKHLLLTLLRGDSRSFLQAHEYVDPKQIGPILDYVDQHLTQKIELAAASRIAGMSYFYFSKFFKKTMGISFTDYVNRKRILKAEQLLVTGNQNVTEIAREIGIENMAHFYEMFKRFNGCTPKQYIQRLSERSQTP